MPIAAEHQGPRRHAVVRIIIAGLSGKDGKDITDKLRPYLISVLVKDAIDGGISECHIELDDRYGEIQVPPDGVMLQVAMGWDGQGPTLPDLGRESNGFGQGPIKKEWFEQSQELAFGGPGMELVFNGWVQQIESGFGRRGGGRRMWIDGTGTNIKGTVKQVTHAAVGDGIPDDANASSNDGAGAGGASGGAGGGGGGAGGAGGGKIPLMQVMTQIFAKTGLTVKLSPKMQQIARDAWHVHESPMNFGQRMQTELGGIFKIEGGFATLVGRDENVNADGDELPTVEAVWGVNLIGWRIRPYAGRPQYAKSASIFFDLFRAQHNTVDHIIHAGTPFGGTDAVAWAMGTVFGKTEAQQTNTGAEQDSVNRRGQGWVLLNGEPRCRGGAHVRITGARPGVDGLYSITFAEHNYSRQVGYTTRCEVSYPVPDLSNYGWDRPDYGGSAVVFSFDGPQSYDPMAPNYVSPDKNPALKGLSDEDKLKLLEQQSLDWDNSPPLLIAPSSERPSGVGHN